MLRDIAPECYRMEYLDTHSRNCGLLVTQSIDLSNASFNYPMYCAGTPINTSPTLITHSLFLGQVVLRLHDTYRLSGRTS